MVDRVYKAGIPSMRKELERLQREFRARSSRTDWNRLRVDPVLRHARSLERLLTGRTFAREFSRLNQGVVLFHSDLVYLRTNVQGLRVLLEKEQRRGTSRRSRRSPRRA